MSPISLKFRFWGLSLLWLILVQACGAQSFQDLFTNRQTFTAANGVLTGSNTNATIEPGEPRHGGKIGGHSLWISWLAPANGIARFKTEASGFDTLISAYYFGSTNGATFDKLIEAARNDDSDELGSRESKIEFGVSSGHRYEIAVDGYFGAVGEVKLQWSLDVTPVAPPIVLSTPPDQTLLLGVPVSLRVVLTNVTGGTKFKWYFNGVEMADEKNTTLIIPSMQITNVGHYKLLIDAGQNITFFTMPTELQINTEGADALAQSKFPDAPDTGLIGSNGGGGPAFRFNRIFGTAGRVRPKGSGPVGVVRGYDGSQIFDTTYATTDPAEPPHCGLPAGASYWLMYQPPTNGTITLDTTGSSYETTLEVYTYDSPPKSYNDLISIACDHGSVPGSSRVQPAVLKTRQYVIAINGVAGARGIARLNYSLNTNQLPQPPRLLSVPQPLSVTNGSDVSLSAPMIGTPPLRFLWRKDGVALPNVVTASLQMTHVTVANSGTYVLAITNDLGGLEAIFSLSVFFSTRCDLLVANGLASLRFPTVVGQRYTLEQAQEVIGPWLPAAKPWNGDGSSITTNLPAVGTQFYRLRVD